LMISLYNPSGQSLLIDSLTWSSALAVAERYGWRPIGTLAPPISFSGFEEEEEWAGGYAVAAGQLVLREDARRFGEALNRSRFLQYSSLSDFCRSAGFVIASTTLEASPALDLQHLQAEVGSSVPVFATLRVRG